MEAPEPAQAAHSARGSRNRLASSSDHPVFVREPEDEDDLESVNDFPVDKTFNRLISFIYDQYPDSRPSSDPAAPPLCEFESFFATSDPQSAVQPKLRWYPRVQKIVAQDRSQRLAREGKSAQKVIPLRRRLFPVVYVLDYARPKWINPDFARLTRNKTIPKSRAGTISFADVEKLERTVRTLVGGFSQEYWLFSSLLSQLKQDGYQPSDPVLFDKTIQSLSASMALQTSSASGVTDFLVTKRRESFLTHVSVPMSGPQKREPQVASATGDFLFNQDLLEKTSGHDKEDTMISSNVSLSRLARSGFKDKRSSSVASTSGRSESYRSGSSYGKRSGSPSRGSSSKRFRGGRSRTPSSSKKGFQK